MLYICCYPRNYTLPRSPHFLFLGRIFNLYLIMETLIKKVLRNLSIFSVLVLSGLALSSFSPNSTKAQGVQTKLITGKEIKVVITKTTTLEELQNIKEQMEANGLGFDYANVVYNDNSEIISISIRYKDGNNNSGNYSVNSENPINDIVIVSEGSRISVKSAGSSNQAFISQGSGKREMMESDKNYNDQRRAMEERRAQMKKEMEERRAEMKMRMQNRRDSLNKANGAITKSTMDFKGSPNVITKNTTDLELLELQKRYDAADISFKYNNLERNDMNEITHISITIDNRNGSVSTSTFSNGKEGIKNITLAVDKQHTIMKSAE